MSVPWGVRETVFSPQTRLTNQRVSQICIALRIYKLAQSVNLDSSPTLEGWCQARSEVQCKLCWPLTVATDIGNVSLIQPKSHLDLDTRPACQSLFSHWRAVVCLIRHCYGPTCPPVPEAIPAQTGPLWKPIRSEKRSMTHSTSTTMDTAAGPFLSLAAASSCGASSWSVKPSDQHRVMESHIGLPDGPCTGCIQPVQPVQPPGRAGMKLA